MSINLLIALYSNQQASVSDSSSFSISRGVKQGDVISPILFNCALEVVFSRWKTKIQDQGWLIHTNAERLTNIRYADDILIFAKSRQEL